MFPYSLKDRPVFSSSDSFKHTNSPASVYSSSFSRATTPVNFSGTPATTANNTPLQFKDMELNSEFQFGATSSPPASSDLPDINVSLENKPMDLEKYIHDLTDESSPATTASSELHHQSQGSFRSVSPFHLSTSIWDSPSSLASPHNTQDSSSFVEPPAFKPMVTRTNSLPKNNLSIDINQANTCKVPNPVRSAFVPSSNNNLAVQNNAVHRRKVSAGDSIWGASNFTPTNEFFGRSITSNDMSSLNSGLSFLNLAEQSLAPQQHLKSPLLASFNHKYSNSGANLDVFSPSRNAFFSSNNASVPRSSSLFETPSYNNVPQQPLSATNLTEVLKYFSKSEEPPIQQLCIDDLKSLNYDKVFSTKAGQLPRFLLPGQEGDAFGNAYQHNSHQLVLISFKNGRLDIFYYPLSGSFNSLKVGDLVFVEADRGKDLGMVVSTDISIDDARLIKMIQYEEQNDALRFDNEDNKNFNNNNAAPPQPHIPKQVLRIALPHEIAQISHKQSDEQKALAIMQSKLVIHKVPMKVLGAEYQWDRRKLTFYYVANKRIDFRDLVKDIFRIYKTRIWMCAVTPTDMSIKETIVDETAFQPQFRFPEQQQAQLIATSAPPSKNNSIGSRHETRDSTSSNGSDYLSLSNTNTQTVMTNGNGNYSYTTTPIASTFGFNNTANNSNLAASFNQHPVKSGSISGMPQFVQQYQTQQFVNQQAANQTQSQHQRLHSGLTASVWNA